jgi:type II secretion system protein I
MRARDANGFLLLEVLLAVAILALGLFALIDGLGRCVAATRAVQNYATAEALLANKSVEFRVEQEADTLAQEGTFADEGFPSISWKRDLEMTENEGMWKQTVTVYWYERGQLASDSVVEYRYLPLKQH